MLVPRAVEVDSQIITVFDPIVAHARSSRSPPTSTPAGCSAERPAIIVGGELQLSMLDLTYEPSNGVYLAPLQMQANNGILVIDDFGRQTASPPRSSSTAGSSRSTAASTTCRSATA